MKSVAVLSVLLLTTFVSANDWVKQALYSSDSCDGDVLAFTAQEQDVCVPDDTISYFDYMTIASCADDTLTLDYYYYTDYTCGDGVYEDPDTYTANECQSFTKKSLSKKQMSGGSMIIECEDDISVEALGNGGNTYMVVAEYMGSDCSDDAYRYTGSMVVDGEVCEDGVKSMCNSDGEVVVYLNCDSDCQNCDTEATTLDSDNCNSDTAASSWIATSYHVECMVGSASNVVASVAVFLVALIVAF